MHKMHNGCILVGDVGSGKSRVALSYFVFRVAGGKVRINDEGSREDMEDPKPVFVITTAKKRDSHEWEDEASAFHLWKYPNHQGVFIKVDSWNNIHKYKDVKGAFFIFDEQRVVGDGAWSKSFLAIAKQNEWVLLSATPGDTWLDYISVFVANGFYENKTAFKRQHVVYNTQAKFPKVDRYVDLHKLHRFRDQLLVELPVARHTVRNDVTMEVAHDKARFKETYVDKWNPFTNEPCQNISEWFYIMRKVVNIDPSRVDKIRHVMGKHDRAIVFYNFDYELELLREAFAASKDVEFAEWNGHKHDPLPTSEKWIYAVQYTAGAEGWNCTTSDCVIFYSLSYSYRSREQAKGRIDRRNTPYTDLWYYTLKSTSVIDIAIWRALLAKKKFNERTSKIARGTVFPP